MDNDDPPVQVHAYNDHTFILRENKAINYEGAFMYLLFGNQTAILIDQGSTSSPDLFPLREVVDGIIREWEKNNRQEVKLIVANSHLHGDHFAAWNQFVDRPNTLMVGLTHEEMMNFGGSRATQKKRSPSTWEDENFWSPALPDIKDRRSRFMINGLICSIQGICFIEVGCILRTGINGKTAFAA